MNNQNGDTNARRPPALKEGGGLGQSFGPAAGQLLDSVAEPVAKYITLATSLTNQLGGGFKSYAGRQATAHEVDAATAGRPANADTGAGCKQRAEEPKDGAMDGALEEAPQEAGDELGPLSPTALRNVAAAPSAQTPPKGRPLNRLAMNRAKFAIRSYTIAVSFKPIYHCLVVRLGRPAAAPPSHSSTYTYSLIAR